MTFNGILYHVADEVATITFNRPEVSNGFNIPMCEEILEAIVTCCLMDCSTVKIF